MNRTMRRWLWPVVGGAIFLTLTVFGVVAPTHQAPPPAASQSLDTSGYQPLFGPFEPVPSLSGQRMVEQRYHDPYYQATAVVFDGDLDHVSTVLGSYPRCLPQTHHLGTAFAATNWAVWLLQPSDYDPTGRAETKVRVQNTTVKTVCWAAIR